MPSTPAERCNPAPLGKTPTFPRVRPPAVILSEAKNQVKALILRFAQNDRRGGYRMTGGATLQVDVLVGWERQELDELLA